MCLSQKEKGTKYMKTSGDCSQGGSHFHSAMLGITVLITCAGSKVLQFNARPVGGSTAHMLFECI